MLMKRVVSVVKDAHSRSRARCSGVALSAKEGLAPRCCSRRCRIRRESR